MTQKMVYMANDEGAKHVAKFGRTNEVPKNLERVESLGNTKFGHYVPTAVEHRSFRLDEYTSKGLGLDNQHVHCQVYWFYDGTGVVIASQWVKGKYVDFFFRCGACLHKETTSKNIGRCLNVYTCKACGFAEEVDSSD